MTVKMECLALIFKAASLVALSIEEIPVATKFIYILTVLIYRGKTIDTQLWSNCNELEINVGDARIFGLFMHKLITFRRLNFYEFLPASKYILTPAAKFKQT